MRNVMRLCGLVGAAVVAYAAPASAQVIGPISWQLHPYCNIVTLTATPIGATFLLEGYDDQCGAATRASATGTAFSNPDGTIGLGLTIVATPGGAAVHIDATVTAPGFSGTWRDNVGGAGGFAFGLAVGGPPRPIGATGQTVMQVVAGTGLVGGGSASSVNVGVNFAGPGVSPAVAHSDHTHAAPGNGNTAVGAGALESNTVGEENTAVGENALAEGSDSNSNVAVGYRALNNSIGAGNVAIGAQALRSSTSGTVNVAVGLGALIGNTTGASNVALGGGALRANTTASGNTALGESALFNLAGGVASSNNIAVGRRAGFAATTGANNVFIGNEGAAADTLTIKIGTDQTRTFIAGVNGGVLDPATDIPVNVDAFGKLGTTASSARFKTDIRDIGDEVSIVQRLRPVSFRYLPLETRGAARQFGLIAEEVAEVMPELVANGADGQPYTVRYQLLAPLLLAEVQRLQRELAALRALVQNRMPAEPR